MKVIELGEFFFFEKKKVQLNECKWPLDRKSPSTWDASVVVLFAQFRFSLL